MLVVTPLFGCSDRETCIPRRNRMQDALRLRIFATVASLPCIHRQFPPKRSPTRRLAPISHLPLLGKVPLPPNGRERLMVRRVPTLDGSAGRKLPQENQGSRRRAAPLLVPGSNLYRRWEFTRAI